MNLLLFILLFTLLVLLIGALYTPLPLSDNGAVRYNTVPYATVSLIVVNCLVFILWQAPDLIRYFRATTEAMEIDAIRAYAQKTGTYGFSANYIRDGLSIGGFTSFTSMFMHGDFNHLTGNMIYLWAFGRRIEDATGSWRFLLFYIFAGVVANMGFAVLVSPENYRVGIGASGAISGVLGAYLVLFPTSKVTCLWFPAVGYRILIGIFRRLFGRPTGFKWTVQIPAFIILVFFAITNLIPTIETVQAGELSGGVNYVAHMAGFLSAVVILLFVRKDLLTRYLAGRTL